MIDGVISRSELEKIIAAGENPSRSPEDLIAETNAMAFGLGAPYMFKAVSFNAVGITTAWRMHPDALKIFRQNPDIMGG